MQTANLANDWMVWDNTEPSGVQIEYSTRTTPGIDVIPTAKRRAINGPEKSPSGGVYVGYETRWLIPASLITPGNAPEPADVVIDSQGTRWTVLKADLNRFGNTWLLGCVNLVLALRLQDTVAIERAGLSYDAAGAAIKSFPPDPRGSVLYTCAARVQEITEEVALERGVQYARGRYEIIVGRQVPLVEPGEDRVNWPDPNLAGATVYFDIVDVHNPTRIDELPVLACERRR
jgi:hypothetical protein